MQNLILTYPTGGGLGEMPLNEGRISFGRGSDADIRVADDSLSRLHATIYREGDRVWIVDENSSNGSFVNGSPVGPTGTPLNPGDEITLGNFTRLSLRVAAAKNVSAEPLAYTAATAPVAEGGPQGISILPIALISFALLIMSVSAAAIGYKFLVPATERAANSSEFDDDLDDDPFEKKATDRDKWSTPEPRNSPSPTPQKEADKNDNVVIPTETPSTPPPSSGKKYLEMTPAEKQAYIAERSMRIAQVIGNRSSDQIPPEAVEKIRVFTEAYAKRINVKPLGGCRFGDNLQATYQRASENAPFIIRAFNGKGIDPRIGLYLAMIESEHCVCLQSPTGPLGMFQFTKATGEMHGLKTFRGASPSNPDERCEPEPSARAAASYMKALTGRYGTGPASVPLAIGSYNSGEGGLSSNLVKALESNTGLPRDFWSLISKSDILSKQFQSENFKYVPKFFAAAIVGENPEDFGLKLQPLSTYSN